MDERTIPVPWPPDTNRHISLQSRLFITDAGFGNRAAVLQVTITRTRHSGSYEGGEWACFPAYPGDLARPPWTGWDAPDVQCQEFWHRASHEGWPVGRGDSPQAAYEDLVDRVCVLAGVTREELTSPPEWPPHSHRGELADPDPADREASLARADAALADDDDLDETTEETLP
jgi:hypothetical protein